MSDYEIIGRVFSMIRALSLALGFTALLLRLAWFVFKELYGWPRSLLAIRHMQKSEQGGEK